MAINKGTRLQPLPKLFVLLSFMTWAANPLETVNLVDFCGQTIKSDGMIVKSHGDSRKYYFVSVGTDCRLTMQASSPKDNVQFQFRFFLVYSLLRMSSGLTPTPGLNHAQGPPSTFTTKESEILHDPCNAGSYVQFYDGKDQNSAPLGTPLCGKTIPRPVLSTGNYLTLRLVTRGQQPRVDFVGDFTSFRQGFNSSECSAEPYFQCQNGKCIPASLVCDSMNIDNCGDGSDQSTKSPGNCVQHSGGPREGSSKGVRGTQIAEETPSTTTSAAMQTVPQNDSCVSAGSKRALSPGLNQHHSTSADGSHTSFLVLYIILGLVLGVALLFWCCWSPGWFIWRIGACRSLPCCNSFCAACHLCTRSCALKDKTRPCKVNPQNAAATVPV